MDEPAIDARANTARGVVLLVGRLGQREVALARVLDDRARQAMAHARLRRRREGQQLVGCEPRIQADYRGHDGSATGQGSRLVENHRVDPRQLLHGAPALEQHAQVSRVRHRRQDRRGRR